tara:strand:+ start:23 stop:394 length:372 start_codon:yes stop_codon:yes gene_type:complete
MLHKIVRFGLAMILIAHSLNYLFSLFPYPEMAIKAQLILGSLSRSGYIMHVASIIQLISGICYLLNRYVIAINLLIMPTIINFFLFSLFLEQMGLIVAVPLIMGLGYLVNYHRDSYLPLFRIK